HNKMANQVNGNAVQLKEEEEPMDTSSVNHTEHYKTLIEAGLPQKVAERLDEIFQTGQRKYGGPPPDSVYSGVQPGIGTE
ncbi:HNRNPR, partial [Cervus elaphus hippelaphus]